MYNIKQKKINFFVSLVQSIDIHLNIYDALNICNYVMIIVQGEAIKDINASKRKK